MTRYVRAGDAMSRVWLCLAESFPKRVFFPREVTTDQPAFFEEAEVLEVLEARRLLAEPTPVMKAETTSSSRGKRCRLHPRSSDLETTTSFTFRRAGSTPSAGRDNLSPSRSRRRRVCPTRTAENSTPPYPSGGLALRSPSGYRFYFPGWWTSLGRC